MYENVRKRMNMYENVIALVIVIAIVIVRSLKKIVGSLKKISRKGLEKK